MRLLIVTSLFSITSIRDLQHFGVGNTDSKVSMFIILSYRLAPDFLTPLDFCELKDRIFLIDFVFYLIG